MTLIHASKLVIYATKNLNPGDIVYREDPLVVGPNQETGPICLGCMAAVDASCLCHGCGYPVCDQECAMEPVHR